MTERKIVAYLPTAPASHQPSHHTDMYMANLYSSAAYNYNRCISTPTKPAVYRIYIVYLRVYLISTPGATCIAIYTYRVSLLRCAHENDLPTWYVYYHVTANTRHHIHSLMGDDSQMWVGM